MGGKLVDIVSRKAFAALAGVCRAAGLAGLLGAGVDALPADCSVPSDAGVTEVNLRVVAVGASVIRAGVALSVGVGVQAVGVEAGQADTISTASLAGVQTDLADTSVG